MSSQADFLNTTPDLKESIDSKFLQADCSTILTHLRDCKESVQFYGVHSSALAYLLARSLRSVPKTLLLVTPTDKEAEEFAESINFFWGGDQSRSDQRLDLRIRYFPSRAGHKAQSLRKMEATAWRIETLYTLRSSISPVLVVTSALALLEKLVPPDVVGENVEYLVKGDQVDMDDLCRKLIERGFLNVPLVEEYGDLGRRGGILDIYAPLYRWPLRMEFFGEELESIRTFNPSTQRSLGTFEDAILLPASEIVYSEKNCKRAEEAVYEAVQSGLLTTAEGGVWLRKIQEKHSLDGLDGLVSIFYETTSCLLDHLPEDSIVFWSNAGEALRAMEEKNSSVFHDSDSTTDRKGGSVECFSELFQEPRQVLQRLESFTQVFVNAVMDRPRRDRIFHLGTEQHGQLYEQVRSHSNKERLLEPLVRWFKKWRDQGISCFLVCQQKEQARRLSELLEDYRVNSEITSVSLAQKCSDSVSVKILIGQLNQGFLWPSEGLSIVTEQEIFGRRGRRVSRKPLSGILLNSFQDLHSGDFVVHLDHGIGIYKELVYLNVKGGGSDFLLIEYQDGDKLYVPVDKLQKVQKYLGVDGYEPQLDKLGGKTWEAAKKKATESAQKIARELLELYAHRQVQQGFAFSPPDKYFQEFEATFAFEETPDQIDAIEDVLADMASDRPMDRLICGDVGYGKTEVAIRAAFKAVMDGKQVAMLAPTTVLAEQHLQTFQERFEGFPVVVTCLSRFKTSAQQKKILEELKKGSVDIVIGTHRLLQKDVVFRNLGLVIIDEEHRFGVKHKEILKKLRVSVDVLTLSATPIPRTLQMSLVGIRDLSTIETPPQDRRSIETYVCSYDELTIKEAIQRELHRGGQVFFVHNHVVSIYQMAAKLRNLVPEARVEVAHGQMKERELERVMMNFVKQQADVLVCTTIIESGLDIPAANTIIINRADKFGLAQIYQLRGRVGRSREQAYAYLLVPAEQLITRDAQRRLRALMDFSELGSGFKIALNDLQIRGGGTILGSAQSGHIAAVGYELYLDLLEKTVRELKGQKDEPDPIEPELHLNLTAFLPDSFIPDMDQRLLAYKRLAAAGDESSIADLIKEWRDRYGALPESVKNLVLSAKTRLLAGRAGILKIEAEGDLFSFLFYDSPRLRSLVAFFDAKRVSYRIESDRKLKLEIWGRDAEQRLIRLKRLLQEYCDRASDIKSIQ